ncbi:MAG TPA: hypothetical protein ENK32_06110, partial [Anaerolineae bacterium]|nr:hypothetical protein [Anaerolineae bacterium]
MRTPEQNKQWWQDCFMMASAIESFVGGQGSYVIIGNYGQGKTIAVEYLLRQAGEQSFVLVYSPINWPNAKRPKISGENHFAQIMALAATEMSSCLEHPPCMAAASALNPLHHEFLCWLIEK